MKLFVPSRTVIGRREFIRRAAGLGLLASAPTILRGSRDFTSASSQYLTRAAALATPPFTFACWFKTNNITAEQVLFSMSDAVESDAYYFRFRANIANDPLAVNTNNAGAGGSSAEAITGATGITTGNWYFAAMIIRDASYRAVWFAGTLTTNLTTVNLSLAPTKTSIGAFNGAAQFGYWDGQIAHAGLWNLEFSNAQLARLALGVSPRHFYPANLVDYWPLISSTPNGLRGNNMSDVNGSVVSSINPRIYY